MNGAAAEAGRKVAGLARYSARRGAGRGEWAGRVGDPRTGASVCPSVARAGFRRRVPRCRAGCAGGSGARGHGPGADDAGVQQRAGRRRAHPVQRGRRLDGRHQNLRLRPHPRDDGGPRARHHRLPCRRRGRRHGVRLGYDYDGRGIPTASWRRGDNSIVTEGDTANAVTAQRRNGGAGDVLMDLLGLSRTTGGSTAYGIFAYHAGGGDIDIRVSGGGVTT